MTRPNRNPNARPLTPSQAAFVHYYVETGDQSNAYRLAYPNQHMNPRALNVQACRVAKLRHVAHAITVAMEEAARANSVTAQWVVASLLQNYNRAMQIEAVLDKDGNPTGDYVYQGSVANRALELLGKYLGMFTERIEHSGPGGSPIKQTILTIDAKTVQEAMRALSDAGVVIARRSDSSALVISDPSSAHQ